MRGPPSPPPIGPPGDVTQDCSSVDGPGETDPPKCRATLCTFDGRRGTRSRGALPAAALKGRQLCWFSLCWPGNVVPPAFSVPESSIGFQGGVPAFRGASPPYWRYY